VSSRTLIRRSAATVAALASTALVVSGCGNNSSGGGGGGGGAASGSSAATSTTALPSVAADPALAAQVPDSIKSDGTITVGTDSTYAPSEFVAANGSTIEGFDVDLFTAVAKKLGLKVTFQNANFDSIITGVQGKKYDLGMSSFTVNADRMKQVNMVSYFNAGTQWATAAGNPKKIDPSKPCGITVAVQKATVQQEEDLPPKQKACQAEGKPLKVLVYTAQDQATAAVVSGKADAMLADSPVVAYAVKQASGKLDAAGDIYDSAPYGYVVPKAEGDLADAIVAALKSLDRDGTYAKVLSTWGVDQGAINDFAVNPAV
jgi:polar amino acid transport system substrate-binding protein